MHVIALVLSGLLVGVLSAEFIHSHPRQQSVHVQRRKAQADTSVYTARLRSHIVAETLFRDNATCYVPNIFVPRGVPVKIINNVRVFGCGYGCQWANQQIDSSSQYKNAATGVPTPNTAIAGPPDVYPIGVFSSDLAWASEGRDMQLQYVTISVLTEVLVTGIDIYQNVGAGGIVEILGRQSSSPDRWYTLWSGLPQSGIPTLYATIFSPVISAPRSIPLDEFKITLDTSFTRGEFSQIDAVKVYGDTLTDGMPVIDIPASVQCSSINDTSCFHLCDAAEVVSQDTIDNTIQVLSKATAWLERALFAQPADKPVRISKLPTLEPVECDGITIPDYLIQEGVFGTELIILPTIRPAAAPIEVTPCRWLDPTSLQPILNAIPTDNSGGRPMVLHVNMVPGFADAVFAADALPGALDAAVDATIHMLYQGLGYATAYRPVLRSISGVSVDTPIAITCQSTTSCDGTWSQRFRNVLRAFNIRDAARTHFGDETLNEVELESGPTASNQFTRLHPRVYNGEIMTHPPYLRLWSYNDTTKRHQFPVTNNRIAPMRKSIISLKLFEDLQYFQADEAAAELQLWGRSQGRSFAQDACSTWPSTAVGTYVCPTLATSTNFDPSKNNAPMCSFDRKYKGLCKFKTYPSAIPAPYRYFLTANAAPDVNRGGLSADLDYCPMNVIEPSGLAYDGSFARTGNDCRIAAAPGQPPFGSVFEEYGEASRCFTATIPVPGGSQNDVIGCFRHQCTSTGDLYVSVGGVYVKCPPNGGPASIDTTKIPVCLGATCPTVVTCPRAQDLCEPFATEVAPSLQIYGLPAGVNDTQVTISIDTANFQIGTDGILALYINGNLHETWTTPPPADTNQPTGVVFRRTIQIRSLPAGSLSLVFQLVTSLNGPVLATRSATMQVQQIAVQQWVQSVVAFSSAYATTDLTRDSNRPASAIIGPNDLNAYGTSSNAWSPARGGDGLASITVKFAQAVYPRQMQIYESFAPGGTTAVLALAPNGSFVALWRGLQPTFRERARLPSQPPSIARVVQLMSVDFTADTFQLELTTPPWTEIDAVNLIGDLTRVGELRTAGGIELEPVVAYGGQRTFRAAAVYNGDATVYYTTSAADAWLSVNPPSGLLTADSNALNLTLVADASKINLTSGYRFTTQVTVLDSSENRTILTFPVTVAVKAAEQPDPLAAPVCYNGVLQPGDRTNPPRCVCEPGAYGFSCEFLQCPNNCTTNGVQGGVCDSQTGRCQCNDNFFGPDCSGHRGGCYLSFDGEICLPGYTSGQYMINAEDENNLNRGVGLLPDSMRCRGGQQAQGNPFGCTQNVMIDLCCKAPTAPSCPFEAGSTPCTAAACASGDYSAAACRPIVDGHCFFALHDPACRAVRPVPPPSAFCPVSLALSFCASNPKDPGCVDIVPRGLFGCGFQAGSDDPCAQDACVADVTSLACMGVIENYCANIAPEDSACAYFGVGSSDCPFTADSAPCLQPECFDTNYDAAVCQKTVETYCDTTAGAADPECARRGLTSSVPAFLQPFGNSTRVAQLIQANRDVQSVLQASGLVPGYTQLDLIACPWTIVQAQCTVNVQLPACKMLQLLGIVPRGPTPGMPFSIGQLYAAEQAAATAQASAFIQTALSIDENRLNMVGAQRLLAQIFAMADQDHDDVLSLGEIYTLERSEVGDLATIFRAERVGSPEIDLHALYERIGSVDALVAALKAAAAVEGEFLTRDAFFSILGAYLT